MTEEIIKTNTESVKNLINEFETAIKNTRIITPLTHCITNYVTVTDCANASLAVGGSPIMADNNAEVEEIVNIASSLVINIGTISKTQEKSIKTSVNHANEINKPVIFDPVGVGISGVRNRISLELVENRKLAAIRGNMSEIKAITKLINLDISTSNDTAGKGVDVAETDIISKDNLSINGLIVKELAKELNTVVIASGPIDIISDGEEIYGLENGSDIMPLITGSGCMLSTIVGSYIGANDALIGAITASALMSIAGEYAAEEVEKNNLGTGNFRSLLIDYLSKLTAEELKEKVNLFEINI